jgi:hypothetical protein
LIVDHLLSLASALVDQRTQIAAARANLITDLTTLLLYGVNNSLRGHTYLTSHLIDSALYVTDSALQLSGSTVQGVSDLIDSASVTLDSLHQKLTTIVVIQLSWKTISATLITIAKTIAKATATP